MNLNFFPISNTIKKQKIRLQVCNEEKNNFLLRRFHIVLRRRQFPLFSRNPTLLPLSLQTQSKFTWIRFCTNSYLFKSFLELKKCVGDEWKKNDFRRRIATSSNSNNKKKEERKEAEDNDIEMRLPKERCAMIAPLKNNL